MANNDTMKNATVANTVTVSKTGEVLDPVPAIEWSAEEMAAIRAMARKLTAGSKIVSASDVVGMIRDGLTTKAKTTFYTPRDTEYTNRERTDKRMGTIPQFTRAEYLTKFIPESEWIHMRNMKCKLEVWPVSAKQKDAADEVAEGKK